MIALEVLALHDLARLDDAKIVAPRTARLAAGTQGDWLRLAPKPMPRQLQDGVRTSSPRSPNAVAGTVRDTARRRERDGADLPGSPQSAGSVMPRSWRRTALTALAACEVRTGRRAG